MSEAQNIIDAANKRAAIRDAARVPVDYAALNRMVRRQRAGRPPAGERAERRAHHRQCESFHEKLLHDAAPAAEEPADPRR